MSKDSLQQAMAIIDAAWLAVPEMFRNPDADDHSGNPLPAAVRSLAAQVHSSVEWQPIETAPKDRKILGFCPGRGICAPVTWDDDKYASKPRPFWTDWGVAIWGTTWVRNDQPTHWMPLPDAPKQGAAS